MQPVAQRHFASVVTRLDQLCALLASWTGTGFDGFYDLSPGEQENLLRMAADTARQARSGLAMLDDSGNADESRVMIRDWLDAYSR